MEAGNQLSKDANTVVDDSRLCLDKEDDHLFQPVAGELVNPCQELGDFDFGEPYGSILANISSQQKRTKQACANCRKTKKKCSDTKPCKGCDTKGLYCEWSA